ncbi:MAG: PPC domain-containing DNA-binding protein [Bryobacteraceae bacterium]
MKNLFVVLAVTSALFAHVLCAQETRREIVNAAPNPAEDSKPNSDKVPDVYAIQGHFDRIVVLRFKFDTDLLAGIEKMVKLEKIKNAVILAGAGSVTGYQVHQVSNRTFPSKNIFEKNPTAPADIIGMNGYVIDGKIHAHMTLATPDKAFGGHLEPGTAIFTFGIVTLGVMDSGTDFTRLDDKTYR